MNLQSQALPRILIENRQELQRPAVYGAIVDEVPRPHVLVALRHPARTAIVTMPDESLFRLFLRHF
ncbi:MAG: hypothetical protein KatS3mg110_0939 [Pirellulaceae bacterium]|nr:MAG: hypothetical protein KatS3mg110_0939 [Pirellulaceae bacterium]